MSTRRAYLALADGTVFPGRAFGADTPAVGEVIRLESLQDNSMIPILSSGCQLENEGLRAAKEEKQAEFAHQANRTTRLIRDRPKRRDETPDGRGHPPDALRPLAGQPNDATTLPVAG